MDFPHSVTVTVRRPSKDAYGDVTTSAPWMIAGCAVAPTAAASVTDEPGRLGDTSRWTLFAPIGSDLEANDVVTVADEDWRVEGNPGEWRSPFTGWEPGMVAELARGDG
ncbi:MAG: hypothetical protein ACK5O2_00610 [Microthrixaceae bacterium]